MCLRCPKTKIRILSHSFTTSVESPVLLQIHCVLSQIEDTEAIPMGIIKLRGLAINDAGTL